MADFSLIDVVTNPSDIKDTDKILLLQDDKTRSVGVQTLKQRFSHTAIAKTDYNMVEVGSFVNDPELVLQNLEAGYYSFELQLTWQQVTTNTGIALSFGLSDDVAASDTTSRAVLSYNTDGGFIGNEVAVSFYGTVVNYTITGSSLPQVVSVSGTFAIDGPCNFEVEVRQSVTGTGGTTKRLEGSFIQATKLASYP